MSRFKLVSILTSFALIGSLAPAHAGQYPAPTKVEAADKLDLNKPQTGEFNIDVPAAASRIEIAPLDVAALIVEDDARPILDLPPRYAIPHRVFVTPQTHGEWSDAGAGMRRWTFETASPGAVSINLGFTRYVMPDSGTLVVRSTDNTRRIRPFTARDNATHGELWTPPIGSDSITIEITMPAESVPVLDLELGSINIGYRRFGDMVPAGEAAPRSGACNVNVACSTADAWRDEVHAVGVISTGGSTFCTGSMLNNTAQDTTPYFLTANHCGINSGNAASLVVFWNYEHSICRGIPGGGGVGDGTLDEFTTGSFFRAASSTSDFTLVELDEDPDPAFNVAFNGWSREDHFPVVGDPVPPPSGACIHHPSTDEKRITLYDIAVRPTRPAHASSWGCSPFPGPGDRTHISVYWSLGVTEPGSSGSPLYDNNQRVIGQLHGGPSSCSQSGDNLSDCYGRVFTSWTGGGTNATRLSNWLDPGNTGALFVDTLPGGGMSVNPAGPTTHSGVAGGPFTNPSVAYTLLNPSPAPINYTVSLTANFGILIDGGTSPVSGTLAASGGTATVTATLGAAIDSLSAGIYNETINFTDTTNSRTLPRLHTVEVGQTGFTTTPANGLISGGPVGGPFNATQVYTLTSTQPTSVDIQISANQPWISINGGAGPVNVNLNGTGANTNITIGYSAAANSLGAGIYNGTVTFSNQSGGSGNTTRPVSLEVGRFTYAATDVPQAINDNTTITSTINVTDNYCVGDVNVDMDITHTYIGDLLINLQSPSGTVVRLHNRTGGTTDNLVTTYDDEGADPPDGPGTLADFDGSGVNGVWTLTVADQAGQDTGTLNSWKLKIASAGAACPPTAENVSANIPDSVPSPIPLDGESAIGATLSYIITSLPTQGTLSDPNGGPIASVPHTLAANGNIVNYVPNAYYIGADSFTYKVNDGQDSNIATASLTVGLPSTIYNFPLDTNPGWTVQGQWAYGDPTGAGSHNLDPQNGFTGTNVYGYNLTGDYPNSMAATQYLTTTAMNLSGVTGATLSFRRWLGVESASYDHANLQISTNGSIWTTVWNHTATSAISESSWSLQTFNIAATANNQPTVYLRWGMGTTDISITYPGWNIDDIQITGNRTLKLGDLDNDGDCDDTDVDYFVQVLLDLDTIPLHVSRSDVNIDGEANGGDVQDFTDARLAP